MERVVNCLSLKLKWLSFLGMMAILYEHSFCGSHVEYWFIPSFCFWGVPWFFFCSGLLVIQSLNRNSIKTLIEKKFNSLVVPYVLWCLIGMLLSYGMWESGELFGIKDVFGLGHVYPCGNRTLWFLRELILYMTIVLLLGSLMRDRWLSRYKVAMLPVAFLVLYFMLRVCGIKFGPASSPLYFAAGMLFSSLVFSEKQASKSLKIWMLALSTVMCVALRILWFVHPGMLGHYLMALNNLSDVALITALWNLLDFIPLKSYDFLSDSAFIYFLHWPVVRQLVSIAPPPPTHTVMPEIVFITEIFIWPILFVVLCQIAKKTPVYHYLSGNRR